MIYTNLESSKISYILLCILLPCVIFMTLVTVSATNSELSTFTKKWDSYYKIRSSDLKRSNDYKVCSTYFFCLDDLNKLS